MQKKTQALLASYATFKELYSQGNYRSPYQILAEFVKYIVKEENLYTVFDSQIKILMRQYFEFDLPLAVIRTTLSKIDGFSAKNKEEFNIDLEKINIDKVSSLRSDVEKHNNQIFEKLLKYANANNVQKSNDEIVSAFVSYLIDGNTDSPLQNFISAFIIKHENDEQFRNQLQNIREGGILYVGISYGISEYGSIKKDLTLFLNTEILFGLMGYNGTVFKELAEDFYSLVKTANIKEKKIHLKYFEVTKLEIDRFFNAAKEIIKGKGRNDGSPAMCNILNGCESVTDIEEKSADFYYRLQYSYGITIDEKKDYYSNQSEWSIALGEEDIEKLDFTEEELAYAKKAIDNINVLRKGKLFKTTEYLDAGYFFITDAKKTFDMSRHFIEKENTDITKYCEFALSLSKITNILWYKLNRGFTNKKFPKNINSILKAQIVLSSFSTQEVGKAYKKYEQEYHDGLITEDQLAYRLIVLQEKSVCPEELNSNNVDDLIDFSDEAIKKVEKSILEKNQKIQEQEDALSQIKAELQIRNNDYDKLQKENERLKIFENKDKKRKIIRKKIKNIFLFSLIILVILSVSIGAAYGLYCIISNLNSVVATFVSIAIGIIGIVLGPFLIRIKKIYNSFFKDKK